MNCCCVLQGNVTHYVIPLDDAEGSSNVPQHLTTRFHNGAGLTVPGRVNAALQLESSQQYVTVDEPETSCFSNLRLCNSGLCLAFYLKISDTVPDIQLLKSDAYSVRTNERFLPPEVSACRAAFAMATWLCVSVCHVDVLCPND